MYIVKALITRRPSILDPQGKAVEQGAKLLGFENVGNVRVDKRVVFELEASDEASAKKEATALCDKLLANPNLEDYTFTLERNNGDA